MVSCVHCEKAVSPGGMKIQCLICPEGTDTHPDCATRHYRWSKVKKHLDALWDSTLFFHLRFGIGLDRTEVDTLDRLRDRTSLLMEESGEHAGAVNRGHTAEAVRELVDILYIVFGSMELINLDLVEASLAAVAEKNDSKTDATHFLHPETGKVVRRDM